MPIELAGILGNFRVLHSGLGNLLSTAEVAKHRPRLVASRHGRRVTSGPTAGAAEQLFRFAPRDQTLAGPDETRSVSWSPDRLMLSS